MSSSFVKDCSDVSAPGNINSGKTVIIIVNNETGNVSLDGSELQNLLASHTPSHTASHGADGSQVSVVRMGSGATVNLSETATSTVTATADGAQHVNLTVEGFPSIPVEGQVGGTGNYAELPLDADAFRRLESVLESEEAREILGKPLLDMVANPEQLGPLEDLMDPSLFGESQATAQSGYTVLSSGNTIRKNQGAPKRRSQRQMDKAEREEVEKILAENHKKMQEEREQLTGHQIVVPFTQASAPTLITLQADGQDGGVFVADDSEVVKGGEEFEAKGVDSAPVRGKARARGRGRGRGKEVERGGSQEAKGRGRGKKMVDGEGEKGVRGEEAARGKAKARGRGRAITVVTTTTSVPTVTDLVQDADGQIIENPAALKKCKVIVKKKKFAESSPEGKIITVVEGQEEAESVSENTEATEETPEQVAKKAAKKVPPTPKVIPQFEPALFSTPDVMQKVGDGSPTQAIMVKGNGKNIKAQKILLVKKQVKKDKTLQLVKEEKPALSIPGKEEDEEEEASAAGMNHTEELKTEQDIKTEMTEEKPKPNATLGEGGILSSASKVMKKRIILGEGKSKVIQVRSPIDVREVVVLNSARTGMNKEALVKIIPPKDPPKEEEKTPGKQKVPKKEGKQQVKKTSPPTPASPATAPAAAAPTAEPTTPEGEENKADASKETSTEPKKKLIKKFRPGAQKGGDLHKSYEDIVLLRKREEAQRKKEEILRRREEILRKREAIKKRKEMKEMEMKKAMMKKEEVPNTPAKETPSKVIKVTKVSNKVVMVKREVEDSKKNGIQATPTAPVTKQAPSTPQTTTIKVIRKVVPHTPTTPQDESPIRRSNRAIKKKTFGDEMVTYDLKEELAPEVKEEGEEEKIEEEVVITQEEEEEEADESMEEDGEDDDPERLWCICQKPHNNRFMICCDRCEDWFHGTCVGVTKAMGQQMEHEGKEWVCPKCKKTERAMKGVVVLGKKRIEAQLNSPSVKVEQAQLSPTKVVKRIIINRPEEVENQAEVKKSPEVKKPPDGVKRLGGLSGFTIPKKVNVVHEAITPPKKILSDEKKATSPQVIKLSHKKLPDGREHVIQPRFWQKVQESARGVGSLEKTKPKVLVYQKTTGKIISGADAPTFDELKDWLKEHPDCGILQPGMMNASGTVASQGATVATSTNSQKKVIQVAKSAVPVSSPVSQKVTVVKSADGRVIVKTSESLEKEPVTKVVNTVTSQPTTKTVIVSTPKASVPLVKEVEEKKDPSPTKKEESSVPVKTPVKESKKPFASPLQPVKVPSSEKKKADNAEVRSSIKKTLAECLAKRYEETKDEFPNVTDEYIKTLVSDIEKELYLHFGKDVGMKYKARYRSILFNTKDSKNSGLFRKILKGTISPSQLARMTSEELASKELLEWREREEKKELQAIEKHELEMIALGNQYIMKSHKGEIEIDKDEFIKEKEKAPDTLDALPIDPMAEILDDSTANHNNHIYDLNCKICSGQQEQPTVTHQDSKPHKEKSKDKSSKSSKDHKSDEPAKVKDRKERKSSSDRDRDRRDRKDSSDKERHKHRSKDHKEKSRDKERDRDKDRNRDKDKDKDKDKDRDNNRDRDKHKSKSKHSDDSKDKSRDRERHKSSGSISNDKEKDRDKERERRDSKDKRDDKDRKRRDKHRDRRDSKDEKSSSKRRDSEKDDKKEGRKRRRSGSRSDDRKRRESEKENTRHRDSRSCEKQKDEVSTSDDVVFDMGGAEQSSSSSSLPDGYMRDAEPSSTVMGSPEDTNVMEPASPTSEDEMLNLSHDSTPPLPPTTPNYAPPPPADAYSPSSPLNSEKSSPQPPHDRDTLTPPPLPDDEMPTTPPLPDYDVPRTPPPPEEYNPLIPPLPGAYSAFKSLYSSSPTIERSTTPPLPEPSSTPPLPRPDSPGTPPLPTSGGTTPTYIGVSSTPPQTPRGSTPPLPKDKSSGSGSLSGVPSYMPSSPTLLDYNKNLGRLTPPIGAETSAVPSRSSAPVLITPEPENVWSGIIHMPDVAKFSASAFEVSGKAKFLPNDVPNMIEVVGRIAPDMVWSYIAQMKKSGSKEILVVRFQPADEEVKVSYIALYSYLSSKKRYAVIGNCGKSVKDFYIVPLASHQTIPQALLPLNGPGFEEQRAHMLIGVIVRAKSKRVFDHTTGNWKVVSGGQPLPPPKISDSVRSCTPPLPTDEDIQEIALAAKEAEDFDLENDLVGYRDSRPLKRQAKNAGESSQTKKRREQSSDSNSPIVIGEEPKSPPEDSYVEASLDQESMLAELNRQIEEHKKELSEMQKTIGNDEDEPYSPSHADDSPSNESEQLKLDTSKISIPSNLQEILDNIREKEAEIKQKEQEIKRRLSLTSDPIVMNYGKYQTYEKKKEKAATTSGKDVDLRPLLHTQTKPNKETKTDIDLRVLKATTEEKKSNKVEPVTKQEEDVDLRIRDPRLARTQASSSSTAATSAPPPPATDSSDKGKTLSKMTDEELLAKALEMEDNESSSRQAAPEGGVESRFHPVMPVPPPFLPPGLPGAFIPSGGPMVGPDPMAGPMPPPMPPVPPPFIGSMGLPSVDIYGPPTSRLGGPHGPPAYVGPDAGTHGSSGYSGSPGSTRQRYPNQAWEAGQGYSGRGWGHGYSDRDRERDWNRDWDREREWDRDRERDRDRDREIHPSRDAGHSRYQYKGRRHDRKGGRRRDKRDKEKVVTKEVEGNEDDGPYPEIDY